ncbi:MAG: hypothetical protein WBM69_03595 [Desulfobacterales bacterium]
MRAVTIFSGNWTTVRLGGLKLDLNQPQKTDSHGGDGRLCLYGLNAKDRGRVQGSLLYLLRFARATPLADF